jgi:hypothetical protein
MFGFIFNAYGIGATAEALKRVDAGTKFFGIGYLFINIFFRFKREEFYG